MVKISLEVRDLRKIYNSGQKKPTVAVDGISFKIHPGECFGLLGPNGAGKSTTINCITGFFPPSTGEILIEGHNVFLEPRLSRMKLGICFQEDTLDTDFSVLNQLVRHAAFFKIPSKEAISRAESLLDRFQLTSYASHLVESLSGGMRRKLQVARALISKPSVMVLDEPTTGLDPDARRMLWEILIEERRQGTAILLSTHYMDEAQRLCDQIGVLYKGKILDLESPEKLIEKYIGNETIEEVIRPEVISKRSPNLEDVFLKMTGRTFSGGKD